MARPVRASDGAYRQLHARGSDCRDRQGGHASRRAKFRSVETRKISQRPGLHRRRDQLPHRLPDEKSVSAHGPQAPHRRPEGVPIPGHTACEKVAGMKPVQRAAETVSEPPRAEYPKMTAQTAAKTSGPTPECPKGYDLLHNPRLNKGTAFTPEERRAWGLEGLLPPAVTTIDLQVAPRHAEIASLADDLQKYLVLSDLQARNETLYYAVLMSDPPPTCRSSTRRRSGRRARSSPTSFARRAACICPSAQVVGSKSSFPIGRKRTCASSSSPTASAFSVSEISALAGWVSRSASSRSIPPAPACRRNSV